MKILVSGGAGYIGSHTVVQLVRAGHDVVIVDNFANAHPTVVGRLEALTGTHIPVHAFDLCDHDKTAHLFESEAFDAVIHFAGYKAVGESVQKPLDYYENNLGSTFSLVRAMQRHGVDKLVFSSSATVYGTDQAGATEDRPTFATNPYGWTKVMQEQILRDVAVADPSMRIALLRYFNPVGAHESGTIGEDPSGIPNNLMPFIAQVAVGKREKLSVFGDDYDTPDGTGVRDYIHVEDLAAGHIAAVEKLATTDEPVSVWNLGSGRGTSVLELLHAFEKAVGRELPYEVVDRRPGDVASSYADPSKANRELGWSTQKTVEDMCADTWRWQSQNPLGYAGATGDSGTAPASGSH
jgi:UDP-glucose 4-epimerase